MTILLFGANGQVGNELRRTLLPHGNVMALTRRDIDVTDVAELQRFLSECRPAIVVNAVAYTAVDKAESEPGLADAINRKAVAVMANYAAENDALLIHYSTEYVFEGAGVKPYEPDDPVDPKSVYGKTKCDGEAAISASGCQHLIFRTSWVYSSHGHNFLKTMLRLGRGKEPLRVVADQIGAPTSAELIADVTSLAIARYRHDGIKTGIYHLAANGETSWYGFASYILPQAKQKGWPIQLTVQAIEPITTAEYPTPARRPLNSRMSCKTLEEALQIKMPDWKVHVDRAIDQLTGKD